MNTDGYMDLYQEKLNWIQTANAAENRVAIEQRAWISGLFVEGEPLGDLRLVAIELVLYEDWGGEELLKVFSGFILDGDLGDIPYGEVLEYIGDDGPEASWKPADFPIDMIRHYLMYQFKYAIRN
jgi:hypothetical protein